MPCSPLITPPASDAAAAGMQGAWAATGGVLLLGDATSVRKAIDTKGATERDPGLADRISQAYERRMGR